MGGSNPYIDTPDVQKATEAFEITFRIEGKETKVTVDPQNPPSGGTGLPGSILDIAMGLDLEIDHACGGVVACSTCHIFVKQGLETCNPSTDDEEDMLEKAPGLGSQSRLACQCVPNGKTPVVVEVPGWNRNAVRE